MFVLRFTQTLLKDMKITPAEDAHGPSLFSWHANITKLNNRKHIIFVNDSSRLSVIIDGIRTAQLPKLIGIFSTTLLEYLKSEGIESKLIDTYMKDGQEKITICKTNDRSVLGTMKEITLFSTSIDRIDRNYESMKWLNRVIRKPINYNEPINVFKDEIEKSYL
ncbi:hypothetical protein SAMN05444162_2140 [Paenibacillaceae bacterium GAS479]|nr:hypothetical protein SAMN05444162_2140 [Paenibacillaceae bacterium GAS479]